MCDLITTYYGIIYPHIKYGITVWGCSSTIYIKRLLTLQKTIM